MMDFYFRIETESLLNIYFDPSWKISMVKQSFKSYRQKEVDIKNVVFIKTLQLSVKPFAK